MEKVKLIEIGIDDPMERLYYERQAYRKKAYAAKQRKTLVDNKRRIVMVCRMDRHGFSQESSMAI